MKNKLSFLSVIIMLTALSSVCLLAEESSSEFSWPIEIESENGFVTTLYQPQLESFEANILEGRMAVTIKPPDQEMIFGALWFKARMITNLDNRTVLLEKMDILKTHFPDIMDEEETGKFSDLLSKEMESWNLEMSLDRILASLDEVENLKQISDKINNAPPEIYFRTTPAILIMIDGDPILNKDEDSGLEYVINTPFFIVKDPKNENYYINGGPFWYTSKEVMKGWMETKNVPSKIKTFAKLSNEEQETDSVAKSYSEAPEIIVETKASELILVDGEIDYKPIEGTSLLYVSNTESDVIMDINSQNHYLLLAGRWYYSKSLKNGDWKFCEPGDLPQEFRKIPEDSDMESVRSSIPGTPEAQTALLEQSIPQTATIDRMKASVEVKYDGNPKFEKIEGTNISYAANTDKTILLISNTYYCVDDAVWFMSDRATGPWEVCVNRPDEVDQIPPESPVYNVKYAYIYESTPEVVYVGYLPGYTHSYVYNGVVVYGTGYYYNPWYVHYYYPRPVTWGYGVHYNPWTGWGFSAGYSYGWVSWGFHPYRSCYWGPRGYYSGYRHGYYQGYQRAPYHGYRTGYAAGSRDAYRNVYSYRATGVRYTGNTRNPQAANTINNRARTSATPNNIYSDRNGNVYQRNQNGSYENRSNSQSQPSTRQQPSTSQQPQTRQKPVTNQQPQTRQQPATNQQPQTRQQPATNQTQSPQQSQRPTTYQQQLDRYHQNRNQGTQNYNRSQQQMQRGGSTGRSGGNSGSSGTRSSGNQRR